MQLRKRIVMETGLMIFLLVTGLGLSFLTAWRSNHIVHVGLEALAMAGTGVLAALGYISFVDSGDRRALVQATTFLSAGFMDLLHVAPFVREGLTQLPSLAPLTCTGGWYGAKVLLGFGMLLSLFTGGSILPADRRRWASLFGMGLAAAIAVFTALIIIRYFPQDSAALHASPAGGPVEIIPLLLFMVVGLSLLNSRDTLTRYLGRSMLVAAWSQALMVSSAHVNDLPFVAAHVVKVGSSGVALAGILQHYGDLFRFTRRAAEVDPLTGLHNIRYLLSRGQEQLLQPVSVLFIDIDHFKQVNDQYGHGAGDALLVQVGRGLQEVFGSAATLIRYGGDEFVALFQGVDRGLVGEMAEQARGSVADQRFVLSFQGEEVAVPITLSLGLMVGKDGTGSLRSLVEAADKAAYKAKALGRNRVVTFTPELVEEVLPELLVAAEQMDRQTTVHQLVGRLAHQIVPQVLSVQAELARIRQERRVSPTQIERVTADLDRVTYLLRSVQELSAPRSGEAEAVESVAVTRVLDPILTHLRTLAAARNTDVKLSLSGLDADLIARTRLVQAALLNLAANGLEAMVGGEERELFFGASVVAAALELEIRDRGPGISLATLRQFGTPFTTGRPDAMGMGFHSLTQVLMHQGGYAQIHTRKGRGTTIRIHLPLHPKPYATQFTPRLRVVNTDTFELFVGEPNQGSDQGLTVGMLAAQSGLSESTIRAWERRYGVPKPGRLPNGYRVYTQEDLQLVLWLKGQVEQGVRIGEAVEQLKQKAPEGMAQQEVSH